ncbi:MAG TPA: NEW3 domain-containing protein [Xanthobacteraceae bacterium]|nr:NEW3 domain-containing protein [Xanthobacteraceae bacterium]
MRAKLIALVSIAFCLGAAPVLAADSPKDVKGLFLLTDYPSISVQPGKTSTIALRLQNYGLSPERYTLSVADVPKGWSATLLGGGQPVGAAMPATDQSVSLQLRLDVPINAAMGTQTLTIKAEGQGTSVSLPLAVTLAKELPAKLTVESPLPALRGTPKSSFDYQLTIKNDSGRNLTVSFAADAPKNFETSFTENYGSQQISSIPIEAGQSKDIKLHVRPPSTAEAKRYPMSVTVSAEDATAKTNLSLELSGQPQLTMASRGGLVSAKAEAGKQSNVPIVVTNTGSAPAENVTLSATAPSGWKVEFEPKTIARIEPGKDTEVQAQITPTATSLAGDYMTNISAQTSGETASTQFRVQVTTSTTWAMYGAGIIGVAVLFMVAAVARFGRR